jgi:hypothetical protein
MTIMSYVHDVGVMPTLWPRSTPLMATHRARCERLAGAVCRRPRPRHTRPPAVIGPGLRRAAPAARPRRSPGFRRTRALQCRQWSADAMPHLREREHADTRQRRRGRGGRRNGGLPRPDRPLEAAHSRVPRPRGATCSTCDGSPRPSTRRSRSQPTPSSRRVMRVMRAIGSSMAPRCRQSIEEYSSV